MAHLTLFSIPICFSSGWLGQIVWCSTVSAQSSVGPWSSVPVVSAPAKIAPQGTTPTLTTLVVEIFRSLWLHTVRVTSILSIEQLRPHNEFQHERSNILGLLFSQYLRGLLIHNLVSINRTQFSVQRVLDEKESGNAQAPFLHFNFCYNTALTMNFDRERLFQVFNFTSHGPVGPHRGKPYPVLYFDQYFALLSICGF